MLRTIVASALGIATAIFSFAAGAGLTGSWLAAAPIAALAAGIVFQSVHRNRILTLDAAACSRGITIVSALATLVALVLLARLTVFMVDPSQVTCSMMPTSKWEVEHSCVSAYFVASEASSSKANIYDSALYSVPDDNTGPRTARMIGPFRIDVFEYPPQFLLLPRVLGLLTPEFIDFRMLWFGLNGGLLLLALVVVAHFMGPADGTRALLLSPLVWISLSTISTLQKGNVQIMVIAASMLAMVFFERRRWWAGGALLAFVTVSKLYPGLLIVYLLVRRQWLAAAWTSAFIGAFSVLTLLTFGWGPYAAFLDHLPGLVGGEAFPALRNPAAVANNISIPGLVFKLKLFGVPGMSFGVAKLVGWVYTIVALAAIAYAGSRPLRDGDKPLVWLVILILATLRSPFLPQTYGAIPPLWLLTLLAATCAPMTTAPSMILLAWAALNVYWPNDWPIDPRLLAMATTVPQAVAVLLVVLVLRRRPEAPGNRVVAASTAA